MIPFDEIDSRLLGVNKDRKWLAEASGRSLSSINSALAANARPKQRSELLQKALTDAIDREELSQSKTQGSALENFVLTFTSEQFDRINDLALEKGMRVRDWMLWALEEAAKADQDPPPPSK